MDFCWRITILVFWKYDLLKVFIFHCLKNLNMFQKYGLSEPFCRAWDGGYLKKKLVQSGETWKRCHQNTEGAIYSAAPVIWVYPSETARSIRRPRPNLMKLSGFVELISLIILLKRFFNFTLFSLIYSWNTFTSSCHFLQEKNSKWCRKTDEMPSYVSQIIPWATLFGSCYCIFCGHWGAVFWLDGTDISN